MICQNENLITNPNYKYFDYNFEINEIECSNYIIVYYNETIEYQNGFLINGIDSRNSIAFILIENNIYYSHEKCYC